MKTKKAVLRANWTAWKEQHGEAYPKAESLSSLKMIIGGLLLFGNKDQTVFWPFFDVMLRQYINLRLVSQDGTERTGATNTRQGVSG